MPRWSVPIGLATHSECDVYRCRLMQAPRQPGLNEPNNQSPRRSTDFKAPVPLVNPTSTLSWAHISTHCATRLILTGGAAKIIQMVPFSSDQKAMGVVVKLVHRYWLFIKVASKILATSCRRYVSAFDKVCIFTATFWHNLLSLGPLWTISTFL